MPTDLSFSLGIAAAPITLVATMLGFRVVRQRRRNRFKTELVRMLEGCAAAGQSAS